VGAVRMNSKKIAVAMSGGVDSSVAAMLLIQQGFEVCGFILNITGDIDSIESAKEIAKILHINLHVIDGKQIFNSLVIQEMIDEYSSANVPNPCILCNKAMKWGFLYNQAKALGFNYLATGHYARIIPGRNGCYSLQKGLDNQKDQSYFLGYLTQDDLSHTLFPLGEMSKSDVRKYAAVNDLPNHERIESQDLCFLKDGNIHDFLRNGIDELNISGNILDINGSIIGTHDGLAFYTIGQRKKLGISSNIPLFVLKKDIASNTLIVGRKNSLLFKGLIANNPNWIEDVHPEDSIRAQVKIRYKAEPVWSDIKFPRDDLLHITFDQPLADITPGQIAVLYDGDKVLGAGKIIRPCDEIREE
jgi:tRNA-uridine 2-sulfurtransferase